MPRLNFKNNSFTTLAEAITTVGQDSFAVVDASALPAVPFRLTILDGDSKGSSPVEIIEVGAKDIGTNVLSSVLRGQEGTTATTHASGVRVENRLTAEAYGQIFSVDEVVIGSGAGGAETDGVAIGKNAKTGNIGSGGGIGHVAIGLDATSQVNETSHYHGSIVMGRAAKSHSSYNVIIGGFAEGGTIPWNGSVVAIGNNAKAFYGDSVAIGVNAETGKTKESASSVAIGSGAFTEAIQCVAIGTDADAGVDNFDGGYCVAIGSQSSAKGDHNIAIGIDSETGNPAAPWNAMYHIAIGSAASTRHTTEESHGSMIAIGRYAWANHDKAIAIGDNSEARSVSGIAVGAGALVGNIGAGTGDSHIAIGQEASTQVDTSDNLNSAIAIGRSAVAFGTDAIAIGYTTKASASYSVAIGRQAAATSGSIAIGREAGRWSEDAAHARYIAIGEFAEAGVDTVSIAADAFSATDSIAIQGAAGNYGEGAGSGHVSIGYFATTSVNSAEDSNFSVAIGRSAKAQHDSAIAIGYQAEAQANNAIAIGRIAKAVGSDGIMIGVGEAESRSIGMGLDVYASGQYSVAIGEYATAHADAVSGIAIGRNAYAQAAQSIAIGRDSWAGNTALAQNMAIGYGAQARFTNAVAIGASAIAAADNDFMLGVAAHNVKVPGSFEVLGDGDGVILTTPDGTKRYKITVDDAGAIATTLLS